MIYNKIVHFYTHYIFKNISHISQKKYSANEFKIDSLVSGYLKIELVKSTNKNIKNKLA